MIVTIVSKLGYNYLFTGRIQPTYIGVIIHLLSTMDITVGAHFESFFLWDGLIFIGMFTPKIGVQIFYRCGCFFPLGVKTAQIYLLHPRPPQKLVRHDFQFDVSCPFSQDGDFHTRNLPTLVDRNFQSSQNTTSLICSKLES